MNPKYLFYPDQVQLEGCRKYDNFVLQDSGELHDAVTKMKYEKFVWTKN